MAGLLAAPCPRDELEAGCYGTLVLAPSLVSAAVVRAAPTAIAAFLGLARHGVQATATAATRTELHLGPRCNSFAEAICERWAKHLCCPMDMIALTELAMVCCL